MKVSFLFALLALGSFSVHANTTYICFGVPASDIYVPNVSEGENFAYINFELGSDGYSTGSALRQKIPSGSFTNGVIETVTASVASGLAVKAPAAVATGVGKVDLFDGIDQKIYNNLVQAESTTGGDNGQSDSTMAISLGKFAANTTYSITLLSARANTYSPNATFSLTGFGGITPGITLASTNNSGTITGDGVKDLNTSHGEAGKVTWTFTTGDQPLDELTLTASGKWTLNALIISTPRVVPEPGTASLGLFAFAGLAFRRRRN